MRSYSLVEHLRHMPFVLVGGRFPACAIRIDAGREACILANAKALAVERAEAIDGIANVVQHSRDGCLPGAIARCRHRCSRNRHEQIVFDLGCAALRIEFDGKPLHTWRKLNAGREISMKSHELVLFVHSDLRVIIDGRRLVRVLALNNAIMITSGHQVAVGRWTVVRVRADIAVVVAGLKLAEIVVDVVIAIASIQLNG